jgi:hypothetical protein
MLLFIEYIIWVINPIINFKQIQLKKIRQLKHNPAWVFNSSLRHTILQLGGAQQQSIFNQKNRYQ